MISHFSKNFRSCMALETRFLTFIANLVSIMAMIKMIEHQNIKNMKTFIDMSFDISANNINMTDNIDDVFARDLYLASVDA